MVDFSICKACNAATAAFFLASSAVFPATTHSDVLQRQAPPGRKILCHGHDTRGGRGLHQAETVAAFAAVEARDDWLPGTEKTEMASDSLS